MHTQHLELASRAWCGGLAAMKDTKMDLSAADAEAAQQPITRKATFRPEHAYLLVALRFGAGGPGGDLDARVYKAVILAGVCFPKNPAM